MIDAEHILGLMMLMAPYDDRPRLAIHADIIADIATTPEEAAALITVSFYETTFGRRGIPWGASASRACLTARNPRQTCAEIFLRVWRRTERLCGRRIERRFALWHNGNCSEIGVYEQRETRTYQRALRWIEPRPSCALPSRRRCG